MSAAEVDVSIRTYRYRRIALGQRQASASLLLYNHPDDNAEDKAAFAAILAAAVADPPTPLAFWLSDNGNVADSQGLAAKFVIHFTRPTPLNGATGYQFTLQPYEAIQWYKKAGA